MNTAHVQGPAQGTAAPVDTESNRIAIPFFQVQERKLLLFLVDGLLALCWLLGAYTVWRGLAHPGRDPLARTPWDWVFGGTILWLLVSWLAGAYELDTADRFKLAARTTLNVTTVCTLAALLAYYGFLKSYPRPALAAILVCTPASILVWRSLYARVLSRPASAVRLLVVGNATLCAALSGAAADRAGQYRVLGFVSEHPSTDPRYLGPTEHLSAVSTRFRIHRVVVAPRQSLSHGLVAMLSEAIERGLEVVDFNTAYEEISGKVAVEHAGDYWLAALPTCPRSSSLEEAGMRLLDVLGAGIGLMATLVLGPMIAAAIVLESGRPIFYRQTRLGRGGRPFSILKFRSMRADAEQCGARWAEKRDPRVTSVGLFLRRSHLDELPQFWNVLRGEMSLVGPRPERPSYTDELASAIPFFRLRLAVRPGLTGLKQIRVGYAATVQEHLEVLRHDLYYIKHRSLALNLVILARTVGSVLGLNGR